MKSNALFVIMLLSLAFVSNVRADADPAPGPSGVPSFSATPNATIPSPTITPIPTSTPQDLSCPASEDDTETPSSSSPTPTNNSLTLAGFNALLNTAEDEEVYKYEGPTTDFTGVPLVWEKVYKGDKCIKSKKFYYCAPCSDLNDEHPSIWIDPATAKFIFEPPYVAGGQKALGEVNFLSLDGGFVGRYKVTVNETNANFPLVLPAAQKQTVVQATSPYGLTPIRTYQIP